MEVTPYHRACELWIQQRHPSGNDPYNMTGKQMLPGAKWLRDLVVALERKA